LPVREAVLEDAPRLVEIERAAASHPWTLAQLLSSCRGAQEQCLLLEQESQVLGFAIFSQVLDQASLLNIAVLPGLQGRGHGRELLAAVLGAMQAHKASRCLLEVRAGNGPAIALYRRLGFAEDGVRKGYYPGQKGREDALLMSRQLSGET
jgi:ribosomal-protein-alanine N-acetyltransferase